MLAVLAGLLAGLLAPVPVPIPAVCPPNAWPASRRAADRRAGRDMPHCVCNPGYTCAPPPDARGTAGGRGQQQHCSTGYWPWNSGPGRANLSGFRHQSCHDCICELEEASLHQWHQTHDQTTQRPPPPSSSPRATDPATGRALGSDGGGPRTRPPATAGCSGMAICTTFRNNAAIIGGWIGCKDPSLYSAAWRFIRSSPHL